MDGRTDTLPPQPTTLIGRSEDVAAARSELLRAETRLLTFTGPGGGGKTRLALAVAASAAATFPDGVRFVDLSPLRDATLVVSAVLGALGVARGPQSSFASLAATLRRRTLLLVLDNFEHLLAAAALVSELLSSCPGLKVIATSREALRLRWEREWPVPPLALPDPAHHASANALRAVPAVALFVDRARAVDASFRLTDDNARAVAEICERLDGLPLAIELAAAQARMLAPEAILADLRAHRELRAVGARDAPARHRTLRATMDWSYDLLSEDERRLFRRLAIFVGTFSAATVAAVSALGEGDPAPGPLLDALAEKNLTRRAASDARELRFGMLDTVRDHAWQRLVESGEAGALGDGHARHFCALAEAAALEVAGRRDGEWVDRVERDHDDLRAALRFAIARPDRDLALRLCGALWPYWSRLGHVREGQRWIDQATAIAADGAPSALAPVLRGASSLARTLGDHARAESLANRSLELYREAADARGMASAEIGLGNIAVDAGLYEVARARFEAAATLLASVPGDPPLALSTGLAQALIGSGRWAEAAAALTRASAVAQAQGAHSRGMARLFRALLAARRGDTVGTAADAADAARLLCEAREAWHLSEALVLLAIVAREQGSPGRAARLLGAAATLREQTGAVVPIWLADMHKWTLRAVREGMSAVSFAAAWRAGQAMTAGEAAVYAAATAADERPLRPLTRREREVATLIARGLTDRVIARELRIGERTVHTHVEHILRKLDLSSRTQVAVWIAEKHPAGAGS